MMVGTGEGHTRPNTETIKSPGEKLDRRSEGQKELVVNTKNLTGAGLETQTSDI